MSPTNSSYSKVKSVLLVGWDKTFFRRACTPGTEQIALSLHDGTKLGCVSRGTLNTLDVDWPATLLVIKPARPSACPLFSVLALTNVYVRLSLRKLGRS